jgi:hypothetical protein
VTNALDVAAGAYTRGTASARTVVDTGEDMEPARRRIDRITDPRFLDGIDGRSVDELRAMRDDCRAEESRLSYNRRLLQGRLDIVRAEQQRRASGGDGALLDLLPAILADEPRPRSPRAAQTAPVFAPRGEPGRRTDEQLLADASLGQVPDLEDEALAEVAERVAAEEARVSRVRSVVLRHLDALQTELVRRYRDGGVADIVSQAAGGDADTQEA